MAQDRKKEMMMDDNTSSQRGNARTQRMMTDRLLTTEQAQELLQSVQGIPNEAMLHLALICGIRRGELFGLQWSDCDLERGTLQVRRTLMVFNEDHYQAYPPKQQRKFMLTKSLVTVLHQHRLEQREQVDGHWEDQDLVFTDEGGGPLGEHAFAGWFDMVRTRAQMPHLRFHDWRLSYLKQMIGMQESARTTWLEN
jgi:integrase